MFSSMPGSFGGLPHPLSFDSKGAVMVSEYDRAANEAIGAEMRTGGGGGTAVPAPEHDLHSRRRSNSLCSVSRCVSYERANRRAHWWW